MASVLDSIPALNQNDLRGTRTYPKSYRRARCFVWPCDTREECFIFRRFRLGSKHNRRPQTHYQFRRRISENFDCHCRRYHYDLLGAPRWRYSIHSVTARTRCSIKPRRWLTTTLTPMTPPGIVTLPWGEREASAAQDFSG